jgi:CelD/BcsL family acetyltransferase involved in cellulose biosynthesis
MHGTVTARPADRYVVGTEPDFDFLSEEYRALYRQSGASAFQAPLWLSMLHKQLMPELRAFQNTVTFREPADGRLVAVLPFVVQTSAGVSVLQPADFGVCDRNDVVAVPGTLEAIAADPAALRQLRAAISGHDLLLFRKIWAGGFDIRRLFPQARQRRAQNDAYVCDTGTDAEQWKQETLRKKFTKEMGRLQRQTEREMGAYEHHAVTDENAIRAAFDFLRTAQHGRHGNSLLDDRRYFEFYRDYAITGAKCGEATTYLSTIAGETVAALFGLTGDGGYHAVLIGADIDKHAHQSTGIQLLYRIMKKRIRDGYASFDMGLGDQGYKGHFRPRQVEVSNLTRAYSPTGAALAMIYHRSKPLKDFIKGILPNVR